MAIKEDIVCSGYDSYDSDTSSFLTESANKDAYTILDSGHSSRDIIIDLLRAETEGEKGLSPSALLIDGTAPLYDLTSELINRIEFTNDKINQIGSKMIAPEGNLHRFEEADQYFTKVKEKYEEYRTAVNTAIKDYNNYRAFTYTDSDEEEQKGFHSEFGYEEISPTDYDTQVPFPIDMPTYNSLDTRGRSAFNEKVDNLSKTFREAHLFYNDPYIPAQKLLNECKGLKQDEEKIDFTYSDTLDTTAESTTLAPGLNTFPVDPGYEQLEFDENGKPISPDVNQENGESFINYSDFFEGGYTLIKSDGNGGYIYYCYSKDGKLRRIERRDGSKKETLTFYHYDEENGVWRKK